MSADRLPGELSERDFLRSYQRSTLRAPQVAADAALRVMVTAHEPDRPLLVAAIARAASDAARNLLTVSEALRGNRPLPDALLAPNPDVAKWRAFAETARRAPQSLLRELSLPDEALEDVETLATLEGLELVEDLLDWAGGGFAIVPTTPWRPSNDEVLLCPAGGDDPLALREEDATLLANLTSGLVAAARRFLALRLGEAPET